MTKLNRETERIELANLNLFNRVFSNYLTTQWFELTELEQHRYLTEFYRNLIPLEL